MKTNVAILYTGGTIGMAPQDPSKPGSPLVPKPLDELLKFIPGLDGDKFSLNYASFEQPLDSSNLGPDDWKEMARWVESVYDANDGFIILHGTDTMAYTSSALAFMFENLAKPVVITGSQLPISDSRTDAVQNLVNSIYVAGYKATGLPCVPEVVIVFADKIIRGCRARKVSASSWAGFDSPNLPPLGYIGEHIRIDSTLLRPAPAPGQGFQINTDVNTKVMDIALSPGFRASHLRHILIGLEDIDAVILRTYGAGNAPNQSAFLDVIQEVTSAKKTVVNVTQCLEGMVEMGLYAASSGLLERGVISALDMTPEAALTKLMWTLGTKIGDQVSIQMQVNQRGEQSQNLFDLRYGASGNRDEPGDKPFVHYVTPDRRLDVRRLSRAVVRFSEFGAVGVDRGQRVTVRVFMNFPTASVETSSDHPRCVATIDLVWDGTPVNLASELDENRTRNVIGDADITLTVVASDPKVKVWFKGLFLAIFARA
jgi:L-asparaginase